MSNVPGPLFPYGQIRRSMQISRPQIEVQSQPFLPEGMVPISHAGPHAGLDEIERFQVERFRGQGQQIPEMPIHFHGIHGCSGTINIDAPGETDGTHGGWHPRPDGTDIEDGAPLTPIRRGTVPYSPIHKGMSPQREQLLDHIYDKDGFNAQERSKMDSFEKDMFDELKSKNEEPIDDNENTKAMRLKIENLQAAIDVGVPSRSKEYDSN